MINKSDITFVVTGKIITAGKYATSKCLQSIRQYYQGATIILVIWDSDRDAVIGLTYDKLLVMHDDDTENYPYYLEGVNDGDKRINSVNKQQMFACAGGGAASTKYIARVRSDFIFRNDRMLKFYEKWSSILSSREEVLTVFKERVLAYMVNMVNPRLHGGEFSFQLSDCFLFGRREDILYIFDGHQEGVENINYFDIYKESSWANPHGFRHKFTSEQFLLLNVINKSGLTMHLPRWYCDKDEAYNEGCERFLASNIIIGDSRQLGFISKFKDCFYRRHYTLDYLLQSYSKYIEKQEAVTGYIRRKKLHEVCRGGERFFYILKNNLFRYASKLRRLASVCRIKDKLFE